MIKRKILITGESGKLCNEISKFINLESDDDLFIVSPKAENLDFNDNVVILKQSVLDHKELRKTCIEIKPDIIINTASLDDINFCENNKKQAWEMNVNTVENLISISKILDARFITFSSDYIFDGSKGPYTESDKPNPLNYYGKTKLASENLCITSYSKSTIIRLSTVYGIYSNDNSDFILSMIHDLEDEKELKLLEGHYSTPTFIIDIARGVSKIIDKSLYGIYHFSGPDCVNIFQIGQKIANVFNIEKEKIKIFKPEDNFIKNRQPELAGLISLKAEAELGIRFSSLENGLITVRHLLNEKVAMFYKNE